MGQAGDPRLESIVGKGVGFDTGGLDIKPASGMRLMKKDMGGAAHALALARIIMARSSRCGWTCSCRWSRTPFGDAMRPGDMLGARKGLVGRDRQHRRGRPADPGRRPDPGRRGQARPDHRPGDADRGGARGAGAGAAAILHRRR